MMCVLVAHMGNMQNLYLILFTKLSDKRSYERPGHGWDDNSKINLTGILSCKLDSVV
jgi:hypothetical protein